MKARKCINANMNVHIYVHSTAMQTSNNKNNHIVIITVVIVVSDIAIFVLKRDVKLQLTN